MHPFLHSLSTITLPCITLFFKLDRYALRIRENYFWTVNLFIYFSDYILCFCSCFKEKIVFLNI